MMRHAHPCSGRALCNDTLVFCVYLALKSFWPVAGSVLKRVFFRRKPAFLSASLQEQKIDGKPQNEGRNLTHTVWDDARPRNVSAVLP